MALEIVFLDGPPQMEVGARTRIRVMQRDADGQQNPMLLKDVSFSYSPMEWGRVDPTADAAIGLLEVVRLVESDDVLLAPTYSISASLTHFTGHTFQAERRVRLLATALEVELAFEVGQNGKWKRFAAADLRQPIDWTKARIGDPATQALLVRDGKPYVRIASLDALPAEVAITFPNGEVSRLVIEGDLLASVPGERAVAAQPAASAAPVAAPAPVPVPAPVAAPEPEPEPEQVAVAVAPPSSGPEPEPEPVIDEVQEEAELELPPPAPASETDAAPTSHDLREEIVRLRRYVASFASSLRARPEPKVADGIRGRIQREVERVRALLDRHQGGDHADLVAQFESAASTSPVAGAR